MLIFKRPYSCAPQLLCRNNSVYEDVSCKVAFSSLWSIYSTLDHSTTSHTRFARLLPYIYNPKQTEIGEGIKELGEASMGVNAYGNNVDGRADIKAVAKLTDAATDLADAGMGVNDYGTNVDMTHGMKKHGA